MHWDSWHAFLTMGGYGSYVWSAFLMTAGAMLCESWLVARRWRRARQALTTLAEDG